MAKEAERLLAETGWLPEPLRLDGADGDQVGGHAGQDSADEALPAFLTDDSEDDERSDAEEDEEVVMIPAE